MGEGWVGRREICFQEKNSGKEDGAGRVQITEGGNKDTMTQGLQPATLDLFARGQLSLFAWD
jgi:hypothetical protein